MIREFQPDLSSQNSFGSPRLLLDANVLASAVKRDILLSLASEGILNVHWLNVILEETYNTLIHIFTRIAMDTRVADQKSPKILE